MRGKDANAELRPVALCLSLLLVPAIGACGAATGNVAPAESDSDSVALSPPAPVGTPEAPPEAPTKVALPVAATPEPCSGEEGECTSLLIVPEKGSHLSDGALFATKTDWSNNPTGKAGVTLARETVFPPYLWVANHTLGTVSRVSTATGREEGRYWVGASPSRTAVDLDGNVWIGGRNDGRLTQILWDTERCPDRNGDGVVQTATAENLGPLNSAAAPYADECIAYSAVPNPALTSIRGIAAGPDQRVWFGYTNGGVQSIHPQTHELSEHVPPHEIPLYRRDTEGTYRPVVNTDRVPIKQNGGGIYGLVVDREGFLYASSTTRRILQQFNVFSGRWERLFVDTGCSNYGIAVDGRDRVWLGCTDGGVLMFDPAKRRTHRFSVPPSVTLAAGAVTPTAYSNRDSSGGPGTTGLAVEPQTGNVWASFWSNGYTGRLRLNESDLSASSWVLIATAAGNDLRGVGFDHQGFAWTHGTSVDRIWKIDPNTNRHVQGFEEGVPVGGGGHYTYSDFTGSTGLSFTSPRAVWTFVVETPEEVGDLREIRWRAFLPSTSTRAEMRIRPLNAEGLPSAEWVPGRTQVGAAVYQPYETGAIPSIFDLSDRDLRAQRYSVEIRMSTTGRERPVVNSVEFVWDDDA